MLTFVWGEKARKYDKKKSVALAAPEILPREPISS